jgi:hypothetical protein
MLSTATSLPFGVRSVPDIFCRERIVQRPGHRGGSGFGRQPGHSWKDAGVLPERPVTEKQNVGIGQTAF